MDSLDASEPEKSEPAQKTAKSKIQRTVDSMQKQMEVTEEETKYRKENFDEAVDVIKEYQKYLKCTRCGENFRNTILKGNPVGTHPLLGVLLCSYCCDYYGDGNFSLDSEGEDKYCRWCGEGGTIFACSKCICGFCDVCIEKHFGEEGLKEVENDDDWTCYFCNSEPLWRLRSICSLAKEEATKRAELKEKKQPGTGRKKRRKREIRKNDSNESASESSKSNSSSSFRPETVRRKRVRRSGRLNKEELSLTEDEANAKQNTDKNDSDSDEEGEGDEEEKSSEVDTKKESVLEKLRSIWKLTQTITEIGLTSSRNSLKSLSRKGKSSAKLSKELERLKSCMNVLMSSLSTAYNSVESIKEDLSLDTTKDEREIFLKQETELKRLEKLFEEDSDDESSAGETAREPGKKVETAKTGTGSKNPAGKETERREKRKESGRGRKSKSVPGTSEEGTGKENPEENKENQEDAGKPLLKVKSFAKMLEDNVYDKFKNEEKEPVVIDLFEIETDESDAGNGKKTTKQNGEKSSDAEKGKTPKKKKEKDAKDAQKEKESSPKDEEKLPEKEDEGEGEGEGEGKAKSEKGSSDEEQKSSDEVQKLRSKRNLKKKKQNDLKATFEMYKQKREEFFRSAKESTKEKTKQAFDTSSESENEEEKVKGKKKLKKKRILASTDEEESEKENQEQKSESETGKPTSETSSDEEPKKKTGKISSGSSDEEPEKSQKRKRKGSGSRSSEEEDGNGKKKKRRRNIKRILKKDRLLVETREALLIEDERKKRVKERRKLMDEMFPVEKEEGTKEIVLDYDPETKEPTVKVHKKLARQLKPHQVEGVRFMWDNCFESVQRLEEDSGSGCVLAHCMGLGKTLQVITLVHTVMTHDLVHTILIICPLSTVSNWIREFEHWLANVHTTPITLYDLVKYKKREERQYHLEEWSRTGGVLVLSYELFRNLTKVTGEKKRKKKPRFQEAYEKALLDPGPDLVVCDEGHLLKNEDTALSKCVSRIKTPRRVILTGTPLQNNLIEYHCMVQFVKPNILGTKKEFSNRFVNPINNGQFEDSTEYDVKLMKKRSHVLHSILDGCIQRFDYSVLTPFLPEKHEYVISISLTETQAKAYLHYLNTLSGKSLGSSRTASLFNDYHSLQRIWTHPRTLLMQDEKESQRDALLEDSEGSLKDFVVSSDEESESSESDKSEDSVQEVTRTTTGKKRLLRSNANDPEIQKRIEEEEKMAKKRWWDEFYDEKSFDDLRESNKLVLLFSLLKLCGKLKDKVLVFSQSLYSLDLIEYFLAKVDENGSKDEESLCGHRGSWVLGSDYFRLDGSTSSDMRATWCKNFNKESNTRARLFLISTRAGGLGINLYGANRVVLFDASWNPSHDLQSIFRVFRFGQKKTCYIYRFLAEATMEEKIYERQVTKLSLAHRVVDEHQIERHYTMGNLQELYNFSPTPKEKREVPKLPKDSVLADLLADHKEIIVGYHEHDSLLENKQEEELSEEERKAAWREYEEEKAQKNFVMESFPQQQILFLQQPQIMNSEHCFINPAAFVPNIPLDALQRGLSIGVTPLPNESVEAYLVRVFNRETWMQMVTAKQA